MHLRGRDITSVAIPHPVLEDTSHRLTLSHVDRYTSRRSELIKGDRTMRAIVQNGDSEEQPGCRSRACLRRRVTSAILFGFGGLSAIFGPICAASDQQGAETKFENMAPADQYRMASRAEEIALARSAAPASISANAEVLVLGDHGYVRAVAGSNGFVCLVERSWFASFGDPVFWDPTVRGPDCLNPAAASTVLPFNLEKTQWALASALSKAQMRMQAKSSAAAHQVPATGAMGYMMSKQQHMSDAGGHWHPHLMFFQPHTAIAAWGANLSGSPVLAAAEGDPDEITIFVVPVGEWSDGTPASMDMR